METTTHTVRQIGRKFAVINPDGTRRPLLNHFREMAILRANALNAQQAAERGIAEAFSDITTSYGRAAS
jgi:hypothetical protein